MKADIWFTVISAAATLLSVIAVYVATRAKRLEQSVRIKNVREQISSLAEVYQSIRSKMPASDARTLQMETIVDRLRSLSLSTPFPLMELVKSEKPGERLAAVVELQVRPRSEYVKWLSERMKEEKPFIGYHAAVALLSAARSLDPSLRPEIKKAIDRCREALGPRKQDTDRWIILEEAESQLTPSLSGPTKL